MHPWAKREFEGSSRERSNGRCAHEYLGRPWDAQVLFLFGPELAPAPGSDNPVIAGDSAGLVVGALGGKLEFGVRGGRRARSKR